MASIGSNYADIGIPWPNSSAYKNRIDATLRRADLDLPDVLLTIIAEYGSSVMITFSSRPYHDTTKCIQADASGMITSPTLPIRYRNFTNIQILTSVLTDTDGWIDLLSDRIWRKRSKCVQEILSHSSLPDDAVIISTHYSFLLMVMHYPDKYSGVLGFEPHAF